MTIQQRITEPETSFRVIAQNRTSIYILVYT